MIPNFDELDAIAKQQEGPLGELSFAALLYALWRDERTAVLEVRSNQFRKQIVLENGIPIEVVSNVLHETIGKFLVERGKIQEDVYLSCLSELGNSNDSMEEIVIRNGHISHFDLFKLMQQNRAQKLLDCFSWRRGNYQLYSDMPDTQSPLKVKVPRLILTGVARFTHQEEIDAAILPFMGKTLVLHPEPHVVPRDLMLNTKQTRLVADIAKGARLEELITQSTLSPDEVTRLVYSLALLGSVIPEENLPNIPAKEEVQIETEDRSDRKSGPATKSSPELPRSEIDQSVPTGAELESRGNEVLEAYLVHRKRDAFGLLDLTIDAKPTMIESAYLKYSQKYAPWVYSAPEFESIAEKAQDLYLAGARAYADLCDPTRRKAIIAKRRECVSKPKKKATRDYFAIETDLLDPDVQYSKGLELMQKQNFDQAIPMLEVASACDPKSGVYAAELAYCRFLSNEKLAEQSRKDLEEATRVDPKCGLAEYYLGEIARVLGDTKPAEKHLRRACKMLNGDRRPTESLKLLLTEKR